jgi:hypothetical protein
MGKKKPMTHSVELTKTVGFGKTGTKTIEVRELKAHWVNVGGQKYCKLNGAEVGEKYNIGRIDFKTLKPLKNEGEKTNE